MNLDNIEGIRAKHSVGRHTLTKVWFIFDLTSFELRVYNRLTLMLKGCKQLSIYMDKPIFWRLSKAGKRVVIIDNRYIIGVTDNSFVWMGKKDRKTLGKMAVNIPKQDLL
jgi:hypothetical protein